MENAENAIVTLEDENGNYWADIHVASNGADEVNVSFNTYNAGQNDGSEVVSTDTDDAEVTLVDEREIEDDSHLLPANYDLRLYLTDASSADEADGDDADERADVSESDWVDAAELELSEGSIGDVTPGVAPGDADLGSATSAEDVNNATSDGTEVAQGDYFVVAVDASGVFGNLSNYEDDLSDYEGNMSLEMVQTNPDTYDAPDKLNLDDVDVVQDPENDRLFFILDTGNLETEAGAEYDVTLSDGEDTLATTNFSVVERSVEITGDFDDDRLQVELDENSTITGESSLAPGSDVQVRLNLGSLDPGTLSQTAGVQDDGTIEADFNVSDREAGEELDVVMEDNTDEDVNDSVSAVFVESSSEDAGQPHSVTITVEDADGNAVSGADVSVADQTETTGDDGQVTFELWHGEYDVTATHDGEETTGTLTINDEDDTTDEGTLVLGEENENINDGDDQNQDDNNNDEKNGDDSEGEDQPGFGIAVALIALLAAAGIALRNRA